MQSIPRRVAIDKTDRIRMNTALARQVAETGRPPLSSDDLVKASIPELAAISLERIRQAACSIAGTMNTIQEGKMIDLDQVSVYYDGKTKYHLKELDDQDNEDERWPEEYQPLTTAKAIAFCARDLLSMWQRSNLFTYRKDTDRLVFLQKELDALEEIVNKGGRDEVLLAISEISVAKIEELDSKFRY